MRDNEAASRKLETAPDTGAGGPRVRSTHSLLSVTSAARLPVTALLLTLFGCSLDDRTLHPLAPAPAPVGSGGAGTGGSGGEGGEHGAISTESSSGSDGSGGSGGDGESSDSGGTSSGGTSSGGTGGTTVLGCSDLDGNGTSDCDETLVSNSRFDSDVLGWESEAETAAVDWLANDASDVDQSGSIGVTSIVETAAPETRVITGAYQCVRVREGQRYVLYAQMLIPDTQEQEVAGAMGALFFDSNNCWGEQPLSAFTSRVNPSQGSWRTLDLRATAPDEAHSMKVRLGVVKIGTEPNAEVRFDNVLVREE